MPNTSGSKWFHSGSGTTHPRWFHPPLPLRGGTTREPPSGTTGGSAELGTTRHHGGAGQTRAHRTRLHPSPADSSLPASADGTAS